MGRTEPKGEERPAGGSRIKRQRLFSSKIFIRGRIAQLTYTGSKLCTESKSAQACTQAQAATEVKQTRHLSRHAQTAEHTQVRRHVKGKSHSRARAHASTQIKQVPTKQTNKHVSTRIQGAPNSAPNGVPASTHRFIQTQNSRESGTHRPSGGGALPL